MFLLFRYLSSKVYVDEVIEDIEKTHKVGTRYSIPYQISSPEFFLKLKKQLDGIKKKLFNYCSFSISFSICLLRPSTFIFFNFSISNRVRSLLRWLSNKSLRTDSKLGYLTRLCLEHFN